MDKVFECEKFLKDGLVTITSIAKEYNLSRGEANKLALILRTIGKEKGKVGTALIVTKEDALREVEGVIAKRRKKS